MKIQILFRVSLLTVAALASGCATSQKVTYPLKDVPVAASSSFSKSALFVQEFIDAREIRPKRSLAANLMTKRQPGTFSEDSGKYNTFGQGTAFAGSKTWFYNSEENYKDEVVTPWVTEMVVKHLAASKLFGEVALAKGNSSRKDFVLEGRLKKFEGLVQKNTGAAIGSNIGGLLGFSVMSGFKSPYQGHTILADLKLTDTASGKVVWTGTIEGQVSGEFADGGGWSVYNRASESLKDAMNKFIAHVEKQNP